MERGMMGSFGWSENSKIKFNEHYNIEYLKTNIMKNKTLFFLCIISLVVISCNNEDSLEHSFVEGVEFTDAELTALFQMRGEDHKVDISEATNFANDVIGFLDGDISTRTASPRKISSVTALTSESTQPLTRSFDGKTIEIPDTIAYLFNFDNEAGFTIVSGDKRIGAPILGYGAAGSLTEEVDNPGLIGSLLDVENYIVQSITNYENQIDSITGDILNKLIAEKSATRAINDLGMRNDYLQQYELIVDESGPVALPPTTTTTSTTVGRWVTTAQVQPLLPVEWNQKFPFNHRVKNKNGCTDAPAGCVAIALAQIMAYWQYPARVDNNTFNWPLMRSYTARLGAYPNISDKKQFNRFENQYSSLSTDERNFISQVSSLVELIGSRTGMKYTDDGSSASTTNAMRFLSYIGYNTQGITGYNYDRVIHSLDNRQPVYTSGYSEKVQHRIKIIWTIGTWSEYKQGHAWVIDGYLKRKKATTVRVIVKNRSTGVVVSQTSTTTYSYANYLHHNWGWEGENGYYYNSYIVAGSYDAYDPDNLSSNTRAKITYDEKNFQFIKEICPYIKSR
ncbi:C10 family peptidase [Bacteroides sp. 519]|uniref:C10 family peptidase n=1 Tax=Bacteroides sp. 519 TaxID=2302937 RepID=UPI0013D5C87C|nr:C10 family peptidase [Bacteroides sp. 519]NDV57998.1 hypothetical protein [Bacteroides sp. 519]